MKTTKVIFEHELNDKGSLVEDNYFQAWKKSGTLQRFGTWLRRVKPAEFKRRHATWKTKHKEN